MQGSDRRDDDGRPHGNIRISNARMPKLWRDDNDVLSGSPESEEEPGLASRVEDALDDLRKVASDSAAMGRLHEIERELVKEILKDVRHLRCMGCVRLAEVLCKRATGKL